MIVVFDDIYIVLKENHLTWSRTAKTVTVFEIYCTHFRARFKIPSIFPRVTANMFTSATR